MECAICYEKFFTPKTKEEFENLLNENVKNSNYKEVSKFKNLLITSKHNYSHICSTPNCECIICGECWTKITHKGKDIHTIDIDDMPGIYDKFMCPYCRNVDWKDYMENVFNELQQKVLGEEEFNELYFYKVFPEYSK